MDEKEQKRLRNTLLTVILAALLLATALYGAHEWWSTQKVLAVMEPKEITAYVDGEAHALDPESVFAGSYNLSLDREPKNLAYGDHVATIRFRKVLTAEVKVYTLSEEMPDDRRSVFLRNGEPCVAVVQNTSFLKNSLVLSPETLIEPIFAYIEGAGRV